MDAKSLQERLLREGPEAPLLKLADLTLDAVLGTRLEDLTSADKLGTWAHAALSGWCASAEAPKALERLVEDTVRTLNGETEPLARTLPPELVPTLLELAGRPFSPDRKLVMKLIDQKPLRDPIREMVIDTVTDFTARAPGAGVARGLTGLAKFAAGQARARTGRLGGLVGAVSDEVSDQVEKRAREFADAALAGVLAEIADIVSNPQRAQQAADIRVAVLKGALELTGPQLSRELMNLDAPGGAELLRAAVARWLVTDASKTELTHRADLLLAPVAKKTLGELCRDWGQDEALRAHFRPWLRERYAGIAAGPEFLGWLEALLA